MWAMLYAHSMIHGLNLSPKLDHLLLLYLHSASCHRMSGVVQCIYQVRVKTCIPPTQCKNVLRSFIPLARLTAAGYVLSSLALHHRCSTEQQCLNLPASIQIQNNCASKSIANLLSKSSGPLSPLSSIYR